MELENLVTVKIGNTWTLEGMAIAGYFSCIMIKELRLAFDMGTCFIKSTRCETICITHGHHDHCAGVYRHNRYRRMTKEQKEKLKKAIYIIPDVCLKGMIEQNSGFWKMDKANEDDELCPLQPCFVTVNDDNAFKSVDDGSNNLFTEFDIGPTRYIKPFKTIHRVPSFGYTVFERRTKIKDEYKGLTGKEIGELRKKGCEITRSIDIPLISYSGDTIIDGILNHRDTVLMSEVLIMECTIIDDEVSIEETRKRGHVHIDEIISNIDLFANVGTLVLCHLSKRYLDTPTDKIRSMIDEKFENSILKGKVKVFIHGDK